MDAKRRKIVAMSLAASSALCVPTIAYPEEKDVSKAIIESIKSRRSVRAYTDDDISEADLKTILECGMLAPSAVNEQPWEFVVFHDKKNLEKIAEVHPYASFAKHAPLAILACLNESKEKAKGMGVLDIAIACENMLLAAHALGLGGVFTGVYPEPDRMENLRKLADLPDNIVPVALLVFGRPKLTGTRIPDRFNPDAIHQEKWTQK